MIRAVLFDLDDTLYSEGDFFRSGFAAVASNLERRGVGSATELCSILESIHFSEGRDRVLNKLASRLDFPEQWVPELVDIFRSHTPVITLAPDVLSTFERLRGRYKLGCITNGFAAMQRRKIKVLGLDLVLDAIVVADDYGRACWKPSVVPFVSCCQMLAVKPMEAVFVGDNPEADMRGARNAGLLSVRIRREQGYFRDFPCEQDRPDFEIVSFDELEGLLNELK
jgi:putative hydrolase of the HAD superfamily